MMKIRWKQIVSFALAPALCLSLAACGDSGDAAGEDWRTTGVVVGSGTITHDGDSVDVLVTADPNSAAFYWDQEEQVLFDSVAFPETIEDISSSAFQISFDDQNGDGESDVLVEIGHEDMSNTTMLWLWDPQERYVYQPEYSSFHVPGVAGPEESIDSYVGLWEYQGENLWLRIREDSTWEFVNDQEEVIESGTLWVEESGITLHFDGSGDTLQLIRTVSGDLIDSVNGGTLLPVEGIQSGEPYFSQNGLAINAAVEMGTFLLENGVCSYSGLGDGYNTDDCYWEITKHGDYTHDGIRELHFDAICYIPESSIPYFDQQYTTVTSSELYDFYTGMWLTTATAYGNSQRGENYYLHTVSWQGNSYLIEFTYSTDWQYNVGDWAQVLTKSYSVYLPEDYDGLVFAAEAQPDNYKDSAKRMQLDSISPEAALMDIDTVNPYSALYFSLCC
ncbi:MAG: hypothetical protein PUH36_00545 [Subdoligranulum sp.]|nr:hypothetical protein [Subdoligranulum sp.]